MHLKTQKYPFIYVAFQNDVSTFDEDLLFFRTQTVALRIMQTTAREPTTDSTIVETLTPDCGLPPGLPGPSGLPGLSGLASA